MVTIFDVQIDNITKADTLKKIFDFSDEGCNQISFVNADTLNKCYTDSELYQALDKSDLVCPDGSGVSLGAKLLQKRIQENVNGTDLFPLICEAAERQGVSLYFLGGKRGVAERTKNEMVKKNPNLHVAGVRDGFFSLEEEASIIEDINRSGARILFVGFGAPRQEIWISKNRHKLAPNTAIGVGGLFDFYSGDIPRAPAWMRKLGIEWTYRLYQEPKRMWNRYLVGNPVFVFRVIHQKFLS